MLSTVISLAKLDGIRENRCNMNPSIKSIKHTNLTIRIPMIIGMVLSLGLNGCGSKKRPDGGELAMIDYATKCKGGNSFAHNCLNKFVVWEGTVQSLPSDESYVRVRIDSDLTVDLQKPNLANTVLVEDQKIRFSGYLAKENIVYPDISDPVVALEENADEVKPRKDREIAQAQRNEENDQKRAEADERKLSHIRQQIDFCTKFVTAYSSDVFNECVDGRVSRFDKEWAQRKMGIIP